MHKNNHIKITTIFDKHKFIIIFYYFLTYSYAYYKRLLIKYYNSQKEGKI